MHISNKISKTIGIFCKLKYILQTNILIINLYYSFVYPYLLYCSVVWGGTQAASLVPLMRLHKKIISIVAGEHYLAHTDPLFSQLEILKVEDIYKFFILQYVYRRLIALKHVLIYMPFLLASLVPNVNEFKSLVKRYLIQRCLP